MSDASQFLQHPTTRWPKGLEPAEACAPSRTSEVTPEAVLQFPQQISPEPIAVIDGKRFAQEAFESLRMQDLGS